MKNILNKLSMYLAMDLLLYVIILFALINLEREQKSLVAETTTSLIRENFLFTDLKSVTRDVEKIINGSFSQVQIYDNFDRLLVSNHGHENYFNIKVKKFIWSDTDRKHVKGKIIFSIGADHLLLFTVRVVGLGTIFTLPLFLLIFVFVEKRQRQLLEDEKNKAYMKLTRQMAHDIRSPIATLQQISENLKNISDEDVALLKSALKRIDKIANVHLDNTRGSLLESPVAADLSTIVTEIINEKRLEYPDLMFLLKLSKLNISCHVEDLKRIISNLVNNSYESISRDVKNIDINVYFNGKFAVFSIRDNGSGIPKEILDKIGTKEITSKKNGNGIGLLHAIEILKTWGAQLQITQSDSDGTIIEILFPVLDNVFVLIDDDDLVRMTWEMKAKKNNLILLTFSSIELFNLSKNTLSKDAIIYIDSDLGDALKGEEIAQVLYNEGFRNISIASGFSADHFKDLTFLRTIISKSAPF